MLTLSHRGCRDQDHQHQMPRSRARGALLGLTSSVTSSHQPHCIDPTVDPQGEGSGILFAPWAAEETPDRSRIHFDVRPDDHDHEVARALECGAQLVGDARQVARTWVILHAPRRQRVLRPCITCGPRATCLARPRQPESRARLSCCDQAAATPHGRRDGVGTGSRRNRASRDNRCFRVSTHITPLWFIWTHGAFWMTSLSDRPHLSRLRVNPRAGVTIDVEDPERHDGQRPNRQVRGIGKAEVLGDDSAEWTRRITEKYLRGPAAASQIERRAQDERMVIRLKPERLLGLAST
jgi:hypothetical protein